jgi:DNA-binding IclR family transcriptional regulator
VAFCREEMEPGLNAIGASLFDHENNAVAAVVVAGLAGRVKCDPKSRTGAELEKTSNEISAELLPHEGKE